MTVPVHDHVEHDDLAELREHLAAVHGRPVEGIPDAALGHVHWKCHRHDILDFPPGGE